MPAPFCQRPLNSPVANNPLEALNIGRSQRRKRGYASSQGGYGRFFLLRLHGREVRRSLWWLSLRSPHLPVCSDLPFSAHDRLPSVSWSPMYVSPATAVPPPLPLHRQTGPCPGAPGALFGIAHHVTGNGVFPRRRPDCGIPRVSQRRNNPLQVLVTLRSRDPECQFTSLDTPPPTVAQPVYLGLDGASEREVAVLTRQYYLVGQAGGFPVKSG